MTTGWSNFLYNSFDPAGFVSVDKPPVALWIQVASVKLFGFHGLSVLFPQVLEGVAAVLVLYHLVQRRFGAAAGLLAALFLAIMPISVAIDRSNNTDSCLVLVLLLAAWALLRAAETGNRCFLLLSMALVGLGFNVKMLAAFVVLPIFVLVYCLSAPVDRRRCFADLTLGAVVLLVVSLVWIGIYDLTPASHRPFAGTTKKNSMLELALGPYAAGRFVPVAKRTEVGRSDPREEPTTGAGAYAPQDLENPATSQSVTALSRLFVRTPVGPLRLADGDMAGQVGWLFPVCIMGLVLAAVRVRLTNPLSPEHQSLLLWAGWSFTYGVVYSYAGGIMHLYYLATLGPPLAALAAIGVVALWERYVGEGWGALFLPGTLLLTAGWELYVQASALGWTPGDSMHVVGALVALASGQGRWHTVILGLVVTGTLVSSGTLLVILFSEGRGTLDAAPARWALVTGVVALLLLPLAWALSSVLVPGHGVLPSADVSRMISEKGSIPMWPRSHLAESLRNSKLVGFLKANHSGERFLMASSTARLAAPMIIATGEAVMARGGFHGLDPIVNPQRLARMVHDHDVRFVMLGDVSVISRRLGAEDAGRPISEWVRANGRLVDPTLWRSIGGRLTRMSLYDLKPDTALYPAP
jgi:4-amino-4-deoxy-L-arabinose transferase-like glycosyltransferase